MRRAKPQPNPTRTAPPLSVNPHSAFRIPHFSVSRDLLIALLVSVALHAGLAFSGQWRSTPAAPPPVEEIPTLEVMLPPPEEPEEPETVDYTETEAGGGAPDAVAPPSLIDTPSVVVDPTAFVQNIQPPPPPGPSVPTGLIAVPAGRPGSGTAGPGGLGTLFDFGSLDQKPVPIMQIRPEYPYQLRREGVSGSVLVAFVVDSRGEVRAPRVLRSSHPGFEQPVLQAIQRWKFKPGRKGGAAVNTSNVQITLTFNLGDAP